MRNSLDGTAAAAVQNLPQSDLAYEIAKDRLQRKYGGKRRDMKIRVADLTHFPQVRDGCAADLEKLAEMLEGVVISLSEAGEEADLSGGILYIMMIQKLGERSQVRYNQWRKDNNRPETVHSFRSYVNLEAESAMEAWETSHGIEKPTRFTKSGRRDAHAFAGHANTNPSGASAPYRREMPKCKVCNADHPLWKCDEFKKLHVTERWKRVKGARVCFKCLSATHMLDTCRSDRKCNTQGCKRPHHWLLHEDRGGTSGSNKPNVSNEVHPKGGAGKSGTADRLASAKCQPGSERKPEINKSNDQDEADCMQIGVDDLIALRTITVRVSAAGKSMYVNALLDDGSGRSYINEDVAAELQLNGEPAHLNVNTLNNVSTPLQCSLVEFELSSVDRKVWKSITAFTTKKVTGAMRATDWNIYKKKWRHLEEIQFIKPAHHGSHEIDLLLGVDVYNDFMVPLDEVAGNDAEPSARLTPLGWTCVGVTGDRPPIYDTHCHFTEIANPIDERLIRQFWDLPNVPYTEMMKEEDRDAMKIMKSTLKKLDGQFCIGIPWKTDGPPQGINNYTGALQRLKYVTQKMTKDARVKQGYLDTLKEYETKGYLKELKLTDEVRKSGWFLPHFPVIKEDRMTTKFRLVFDASAKDGCASLNDFMHQGPKLQRDLVNVLQRFRRYPIAIVCDVSQMYLRIRLLEKDKPYHRFLFQEAIHLPVKCYQMNSVTFGIKPSPCMAQVVSIENANENKEEMPRAAETVTESTYMDDGMDSEVNDTLAIKLYEDLRELWRRAGMPARKWMSNSATVLQQIPQEDRCGKLDLTASTLPDTKTLGVAWAPEQDWFKFSVPKFDVPEELTKRQMLSLMARLFDPLGFVSPVFIQAKIIFQMIWMKGIGWDELLSENLNARAHVWFEELQDLETIHIPRALQLYEHSSHVSVHVYVDASLEAYGAVGYVRHMYTNQEVSVRIGMSRSRVTPLQSLSVPRLELMAAVLGIKVAETLGRALCVGMSAWYFWSDSMDVLHWVRGRSREFKPFIGNRIGVIQTRSLPSQWNHVATEINPADKISRGISCTKLGDDKLWWQGPEYLLLQPEDWPKTELSGKINEKDKRNIFRETHCAMQMDEKDKGEIYQKINLEDTRLDPIKWSNIKKLRRTLAYVLRFMYNAGSKKIDRMKSMLAPIEIQGANHLLLRNGQQCFEPELKLLKLGRALPAGSKLLPLNPWIDDDGVIRASTRLSQGEFIPYEQKYPIILPKIGAVTRLVVREAHEKVYHAGTNRVFYELSTNYWILSCREAIREWERECCGCKRRRVKPLLQQMAPLPSFRVDANFQPFSVTSVDFAGPFLTIQGRGRVRAKRYMCLFVCVQIRAVHLELAEGLDAASFLAAFTRMCARRGVPKRMISDNGTNFVAADRELRELWSKVDTKKITDQTSDRGVLWEFNPPAAPHFNGLHESLVKSAKRVLREIMRDADVTDLELMTMFTQVEDMLNSRPLTYQSGHPDDLIPLTPHHFMMGRSNANLGPEDLTAGGTAMTRRWRRLQQMSRRFWERWIHEWVNSLAGRPKWQQERENIAKGDIVIMVAPEMPRSQWPLGRIVNVFPGKDGNIRTVDVRVGQQTYRRPIVKLCLLEKIADTENQHASTS